MLVHSLYPLVRGGRNTRSFCTPQFGVAGMLVPSLPFSSGWQECWFLLYPSIRGGRYARSFSTLQFRVARMLVPSLPFSSGRH